MHKQGKILIVDDNEDILFALNEATVSDASLDDLLAFLDALKAAD